MAASLDRSAVRDCPQCQLFSNGAPTTVRASARRSQAGVDDGGRLPPEPTAVIDPGRATYDPLSSTSLPTRRQSISNSIPSTGGRHQCHASPSPHARRAAISPASTG